MSNSVIILGPAYPLRGGGLATFNERLAREFQREGDDVTIYTFSLQYPDFLFPGKTQYSSEPPPRDIKIKVCINSVYPLNWIQVGNELKNLKPDIIVVRYWLPFMAPCFGTILRRVKLNRYTKIICIADNVSPHEKHRGDKQLTKYFIKPVDAFITLSENVMRDLRTFTQKPAKQTVHPLYDNFGEKVDKATAREYLNINTDENIILFFGFIRKYKGLDLLLEAISILKKNSLPDQFSPAGKSEMSRPNDAVWEGNLKLLIAGEFYESKKKYDDLIAQLNIADQLILRTDFISDSEVKYYLSACDFVVQPYRDATQSGVTPLAYHFEKPMLVTNVGGLPQLVPDGKAGLVCEPTPASIASHIVKLYQLGEDYFLPQLREEKKKYNWSVLVNIVKELAE